MDRKKPIKNCRSCRNYWIYIFTVLKFTRAAAKAATKTTSGIGKSIANFLKKFGPSIAGIGSLIFSLLNLLAQGVMWIANNLWILLLALIGFLYNEYKKQRH